MAATKSSNAMEIDQKGEAANVSAFEAQSGAVQRTTNNEYERIKQNCLKWLKRLSELQSEIKDDDTKSFLATTAWNLATREGKERNFVSV